MDYLNQLGIVINFFSQLNHWYLSRLLLRRLCLLLRHHAWDPIDVVSDYQLIPFTMSLPLARTFPTNKTGWASFGPDHPTSPDTPINLILYHNTDFIASVNSCQRDIFLHHRLRGRSLIINEVSGGPLPSRLHLLRTGGHLLPRCVLGPRPLRVQIEQSCCLIT